MYSVKENILRSAMASKISYYEHAKVKQSPNYALLNGNRDNAMKRIYNTKKSVSCDVWTTGETSKIVSFRGSISVRNIMSVLNDKLCPFSYREHSFNVHKGILETFNGLSDELTDMLTDDMSKQQNILFCGHSMGGSMAEFAALYYGLMFHGRYNISCHTFGAPLVGDQQFIDVFDRSVKEHAHFVNMGDVVPLLPLTYDVQKKNVINFGAHYTKNKNIFHAHDLDTYISNVHSYIEVQKFK